MSRLHETSAGAGNNSGGSLSGALTYALIIVGAIIASSIAAIALAVVLRQNSDLSDSRYERDSLLESMTDSMADPLIEPEQYFSVFDENMREINPDYVCWINIDGTPVDYPVVRGSDNEKYLTHNFSGEENMFGALFMDYRCIGDYVPHIIIYGHNSRQGDMFGSLRNYLDGQYLADHPVITLKVNDRIVEYEVFSAKKTDAYDPVYFLDFRAPGSFRSFLEMCGAPSGAVQIITLSTCVSGDDEDERVIVQGVLR